MSKLGGERYSVQQPIIQYVSEAPAEYATSSATGATKDSMEGLGWEYVSPEDAIRFRGGEGRLTLSSGKFSLIRCRG